VIEGYIRTGGIIPRPRAAGFIAVKGICRGGNVACGGRRGVVGTNKDAGG